MSSPHNFYNHQLDALSLIYKCKQRGLTIHQLLGYPPIEGNKYMYRSKQKLQFIDVVFLNDQGYNNNKWGTKRYTYVHRWTTNNDYVWDGDYVIVKALGKFKVVRVAENFGDAQPATSMDLKYTVHKVFKSKHMEAKLCKKDSKRDRLMERIESAEHELRNMKRELGESNSDF